MQKFYDEEPSLDFKKNHFKVSQNFFFFFSVASRSVKYVKQGEDLETDLV